MALSDVEFTDEDLVDTVEPVMEIADALANVLWDLFRSDAAPSKKAFQKSVRALADKLLRFMKEVE